MKSLRSFALLAALAVGLASLTACGTGTAPGADAAASAPAATHFKADLAAGYGAVEAVRVVTANALQAHAISVDQAKAVQTQCAAFTATLDSLRAAGDSSTSQSALTATLAAINAATIFITASQGVQKS